MFFSIISLIISVEVQITLLSLLLVGYCDIDCSPHIITDQVICHQVHIKNISVFILVIKQQWLSLQTHGLDLIVTWFNYGNWQHRNISSCWLGRFLKSIFILIASYFSHISDCALCMDIKIVNLLSLLLSLKSINCWLIKSGHGNRVKGSHWFIGPGKLGYCRYVQS